MVDVESLWDLPPEWAWQEVGDAGEAIVGKQRTSSESWGNARRYPYLRVANVGDDAIDSHDVKAMPFGADERRKFALRSGDVLLCEGQSPEWVGRASIFTASSVPLYFQNTLIRFRSRPGIDPGFALLIFRLYQRLGVFRSIAKTTTNLAHLGLNRFRGLPFPVPPLAVQESIATTSRQMQDEVDMARSALESASTQASETMRRVRSEVLLGSVSARLPEVSDGLPDATSGWEIAAGVVDPGAPIIYGILQPGPNVLSPAGVPYIRGSELRDGYILVEQLRRTTDEIASRYVRSQLHAHDVLLSLVREPRVAVVPPELHGANVTQGVARLRAGESVTARYLMHWLRSAAARDWLLSRQRGIDMPGLNLRDVRQVPVRVVPLDEQRRLVDILDQAESNLARVIPASVGGRIASLETGALWASMWRGAGLEPASIPPSIGGGHARGPERDIPLVAGGPQVKESYEFQEPISTDEIAAATAELGLATPETLFAALSLGEADVDRFYFALRDAVSDSIIEETRDGGVPQLRAAE